MTTDNGGLHDPKEADAADVQWQNEPLQDDPDTDDTPLERPASWEANDADVQEQALSINPDEDDDYPHGEAP
jgi:hypothetical protein